MYYFLLLSLLLTLQCIRDNNLFLGFCELRYLMCSECSSSNCCMEDVNVNYTFFSSNAQNHFKLDRKV